MSTSSAIPSLDEIMELMNEPQLKYRRLHLKDYVRELSPKPAVMSAKITLPSFFKSLFTCGTMSGMGTGNGGGTAGNVNVLSVSGKKYSFWHCLLYTLYPGYIELSWYQRKKLVDQLLDELTEDADKFSVPEIADDFKDIYWTGLLPSDTLYYYMCERFHLNIIIVDNTQLHFYFPDAKYHSSWPTVLLYRDDRPTFHVITIDECALLTGINQISSLAPALNSFLVEHTPKDSPGYRIVNGLSTNDMFKLQSRGKLNGLKVAELRALAEKYGLSVMKQGKTKQVKKTKKELIENILEWHCA